MSNALNPYAAPAARVDDVPASGEAETIRRAHIAHEASIKSIGLLYYLGGALLLLSGAALLVGGPLDASGAAAGVVSAALGIGYVLAGWGVRALRPWARITGCVLAAVGLLAFPIGTLINAYVLYLLLARKGRTIFAPEYQEVIAATPHVKHRTSLLIWAFLVLIVVLMAVALFGATR